MTKTGEVELFFRSEEDAASLSNGEIARRLGCSRTLVSRVRQRLGAISDRRLARVAGELRWMDVGAIGRSGETLELARVVKRVGDAWIAYEELEVATEEGKAAFYALWQEITPAQRPPASESAAP